MSIIKNVENSFLELALQSGWKTPTLPRTGVLLDDFQNKSQKILLSVEEESGGTLRDLLPSRFLGLLGVDFVFDSQDGNRWMVNVTTDEDCVSEIEDKLESRQFFFDVPCLRPTRCLVALWTIPASWADLSPSQRDILVGQLKAITTAGNSWCRAISLNLLQGTSINSSLLRKWPYC